MADSGQRLKAAPSNGATDPRPDTSAPAGLAHLAGYSTPDIVRALEAQRPWFAPLSDILLWPSRWLFWPFRRYPLSFFTVLFWLPTDVVGSWLILALVAAVLADKELRRFARPNPSTAMMVDYLMSRQPLPNGTILADRRELLFVLRVTLVLLLSGALASNFMAFSYYLFHGLLYAFCGLALAAGRAMSGPARGAST